MVPVLLVVFLDNLVKMGGPEFGSPPHSSVWIALLSLLIMRLRQMRSRVDRRSYTDSRS